MKFVDRAHVENLGRFGRETIRDERGFRAKQLNSFWLYVDEDDLGYTKHAINDGFWESWITLWMDRNVPEGCTVLDIGANHGYYSFFLASRGCEVTAVEPQPRLWDLILKSDKVNQFGISTIHAAVSNEDDTVIDMMVPIHHGMNATISNQFTHAPDGYETIKVHTFSLDSQIGFDFIKVDAEGAEDLIWAGSEEYRQDYPNTLWLMEWRWDRYRLPVKFAREILRDFDVTYVEFDGSESKIQSIEHLATKKNEDWMLVLRSKR